MDVKQAYNTWANQYDTNSNKTRDLEATALRQSLLKISFNHCLEIGCGTGKNTEWLLTKTNEITAVDLSDEMLSKAKEKIKSGNVKFVQADINQEWNFGGRLFNLVSFSLVLEHISDLDSIFKKCSDVLITGGYIYVGELHPFKQYAGTKARFDTEDGQQIVTCFNHNLSDFTQPAKKYGFEITDVNEWFDDNDHQTTPRILTIILRKL